MQVPGLLTAALTKQEQILARVKEGNRFFIKVLDRFSCRRVFPAIPSACNHTDVCLCAHPTETDFILEGCAKCEVICNHSIQTGEWKTVYEASVRPVKMCLGPTGSILILEDFFSKPTVFKLIWEKEQRKLNVDKCVSKSRLVYICYAERFDVLVCMQENGKIEAVKLENSRKIWKLSDNVGGHVIRPDALTTDAEGNIYVSDEVNRILKINGLTGKLLSTVQLEEKNKDPIRDLFWSDSENNLIVVHGHRISSHCVPELD